MKKPEACADGCSKVGGVSCCIVRCRGEIDRNYDRSHDDLFLLIYRRRHPEIMTTVASPPESFRPSG